MADALQLNLSVDTAQAVGSINTFFNTFEQGAAKAKRDLRSAFSEPIETEVVLSVKGDKVVAQMRGIEDNTKKIARAADALNGKFGKTPAELQKSISVLKSLRSNTEAFDKRTGKATKEWIKVNRQLKIAQERLARMGSARMGGNLVKSGQDIAASFTKAGIVANVAFAGMTMAANAARGAIDGMVQRARDLGQLSLALQTFVDNQESVNAVMELAQVTGMTYGVSIQSVEKAWKRVGPAAAAAGLTIRETNDVITAATARMAQMGLNSEQAKRYMEALAQVMGKGALQGEELRQQFSELDGALRAQLAKWLAANKGITDLDAAMKKNAITAEMFAEGIAAISAESVENLKIEIDDLQASFDKLNPEQRINTINNVFAKAGEEWGKVFGPFVESLQRAALAIGSYLATWNERFPETAKVMQEAFQFAGEVIEMAVHGIIFIIEALSRWFEKSAKDGKNFFDMIFDGIPVLGTLNNIVKTLTGKSIGERMAEGWGESVEGARRLSGELGNVGGMFEDIEELLKKAEEGQKDMGAATADAKVKAEALKQEIKDIDAEMKGLDRAWQDYKQGAAEAKEAAKRVRDEQIALIDSQIEKVKASAEAQKRAYADEKASLEKAKEASERRYDAAMKAQERKTAKALKGIESEIAQTERAKAAGEARYDRQMAKIDRKLEKLRNAHEAEMAMIRQRRDTELAAIDDVIAKIQSAHQARMGRLSDQRDAVNAAYEAEKSAISAAAEAGKAQYDAAKSAMQARYDAEKQRIDSRQQAIKASIDMEREQLNQLKDQINARYDAEEMRLDSKMSKIRSMYDAEMAKINELSPAEKALAQLTKEKLQAVARDRSKSTEDRLRAQAQLDSMERQVKAAELKEQMDNNERIHSQGMTRLESRRAQLLEHAEQSTADRVASLEAESAALDRSKQTLDRMFANESNNLDDAYAKFTKSLSDRAAALDKARDEQLDRIDAVEKREDQEVQDQVQRLNDKKSKVEEYYDFVEEQVGRENDKETEELENYKTILGQRKTAYQKNQDDKIAYLKSKESEVQAVHDAEMERLEDEKEEATAKYTDAITELGNMEKESQRVHKDEIDRLKDQKKASDAVYKDAIQDIKDRETEAGKFYVEEKRRLEDLKTKTKNIGDAWETSAGQANQHAGAVENVATSYNNYATSLNNAATAMRNYRAAASGGSNTSGSATSAERNTRRGTAFRFAGGPVSGGSNYTVNELGQEAFLSAAGKLSMINAPAFGDWKAPTTGTVIPAHLTSQLSIPKGGINLNSSRAGTSPVGSAGNNAGLMKAIGQIQASNTTNNVTIQAANTAQAASEVLVNLNRIKRNRR